MEEKLKNLTKLNLSENQLKVIKDKYLKDSPTVEDWLKTVCHNIALSEILHSKKIPEEEVFEGVRYEKIEYNSNGTPAKIYLLHKSIYDHNERSKNFKKFIA